MRKKSSLTHLTKKTPSRKKRKRPSVLLTVGEFSRRSLRPREIRGIDRRSLVSRITIETVSRKVRGQGLLLRVSVLGTNVLGTNVLGTNVRGAPIQISKIVDLVPIIGIKIREEIKVQPMEIGALVTNPTAIKITEGLSRLRGKS
jgi:hypothetical protein